MIHKLIKVFSNGAFGFVNRGIRITAWVQNELKNSAPKDYRSDVEENGLVEPKNGAALNQDEMAKEALK